MSIIDMLKGKKVFCPYCGKRIIFPDGNVTKKDFVEYRDGYYCLSCDGIRNKKLDNA